MLELFWDDVHFSSNAATELSFWTPHEAVAEATVDGILKNRKYVSIPCFLTKLVLLLKYVFAVLDLEIIGTDLNFDFFFLF